MTKEIITWEPRIGLKLPAVLFAEEVTGKAPVAGAEYRTRYLYCQNRIVKIEGIYSVSGFLPSWGSDYVVLCDHVVIPEFDKMLEALEHRGSDWDIDINRY